MGQGFSAVGTGALTANATRTVFYLRPPTKVDMKVTQVSIEFDNSAAGEGFQVQFCRITTLGTPTASTPTIVKRNPYGPATDSLGVRYHVTASEPTMDVMEEHRSPPNGGGVLVQFPLGREPLFKSNDSNDAFAVRIITPSGSATPDYSVTVHWEEGA